MKAEDIFDALGGIDEELAAGALVPPRRKKSALPRYAAIAACLSLAVILCSVILIRRGGAGEQPVTLEEPSESEISAVISAADEPLPADNVLCVGSSGGVGSSMLAKLTVDEMVEDSDAVVFGKVVEMTFDGHSNPTGEAKNALGEIVPNGTIKKYAFLVGKTYRGSVVSGDVIEIDCFYETGLPFGTTLPDGVTVSTEDGDPFELVSGGKGVLILCENDISTPASGGVSYYVLGRRLGAFGMSDAEGRYVNAAGDVLDLK